MTTMEIERAKILIIQNIGRKETKKDLLKALRDSYCFIEVNIKD